MIADSRPRRQQDFPKPWNERIRWSEGYRCGELASRWQQGSRGLEAYLVELVEPKQCVRSFIARKRSYVGWLRSFEFEDREIRDMEAANDPPSTRGASKTARLQPLLDTTSTSKT